MLPKGDELKNMLAEAKKEKAVKAEKRRLEEIAAFQLRKKDRKEKLEKEIEGLMTRIEEQILYAIKNGDNKTIIRFGNGIRQEPEWEEAVARLKKNNKDYKFEISYTTVHRDNFSEAANVDYVTAREWSEPMWELKVEIKE